MKDAPATGLAQPAPIAVSSADWPRIIASGSARGILAGWAVVAPVAGPFLVFAFLFAVLGYEYLKPQFNWDMIAYLASAMDEAGVPFFEVHATVYEAIRAVAPAGDFTALTTGDAYRLRQFEDSAALQSMLPMYEVKWLYVALLGIALPLFGVAHAALAINSLAALLFGASLWAWMSRHRLQRFAPVLLGVFIALNGPDLMRGMGPDFVTLALLTSGLMMWDRGRTYAAMVPLTLAVLARPDSAIFIGGFVILLVALRDRDSLKAGLLLALAAGAYVFATSAAHHIGWWPHFWFSTVRIQDSLAGFAPEFSVPVYLYAVAHNAMRTVTESVWAGWWALGFVAILWGAARQSRDHAYDSRLILLAAAVIGTLGKFLLFPLPDDRLYTPLLIPAFIIGLAWLAGQAGMVTRRERTQR
ncbi:MAG: hypothetical protein MUC58_04225 [Rhizobiaceae bacterium]|nr:hypothetical protein [Rhizobiaceae bacterium]